MTDPIGTIVSPTVRARSRAQPRAWSRVRAWWWIAAAFLGAQISIACIAAIESPADVIDANFSPSVDRRDACQITWLVGDLDTAESVRDGMERCGHDPVLSSVSRHYYFDTSRLRLDAFTTAVTLYRLTP